MSTTKNATKNVVATKAIEAAETILDNLTGVAGPARQYALPIGPSPSREWVEANRLEKAREIVSDWRMTRQSVKCEGLTDKAIEALSSYAVVPAPKEGSQKKVGSTTARAALAAATAGIDLTLLGRFGDAARAASAAVLGEVG